MFQGVVIGGKTDVIRRFHSSSKKDVQEVDCEASENCSRYLETESVPFRQQFAALANTGAFHEVIRFENVRDADAREC